MNPAITYIPLILFGVLLNALAQLALKKGMLKIGYFAFDWHHLLPIVSQVALSPYILLGLSFYGLSVVVWLLVLSRVEVSFAYPMLSVGYIVNTLAAYYLFDENITSLRLAGIFVIIVGVYLISRS